MKNEHSAVLAVLAGRIQDRASEIFSEIVALRRDIHLHPELSYEEVRTTALITDYLVGLGITPEPPLLETGVVALIHGTHKSSSGIVVALRADIDALPLNEENLHGFCSLESGKMHACGHDMHTAMLLGAANILSGMKDELEGDVLLVFQPAEEKAPGGAKPFLDAGQTLPAFVYLVPMLALFGPTRFTAIVTGIIYSIPVVVKIVGQGIKEVSATMIEAATSAGSSAWQIITKVQLPAAKKSLLLATNQGLIFVLAVIVIGGFVGSGGLGYLVIVGSVKTELQGKGLVAGFVILLLGVMIDRIAHASARKYGN